MGLEHAFVVAFLVAGAAAGFALQVGLHGERLFLIACGVVGAIGCHIAGLGVVLEAGIQNFQDTEGELGLFDGDKQLDPAVEVAAHPVGAGHVHQRVAAVVEVEEACVLQVAIHDAGDAGTGPGLLSGGSPAADATDVELDVHPGFSGLLQRLHHLHVVERIHLGADDGAFALLGSPGFGGDEFEQAALHGGRGRVDTAEAHEACEPGHGIEELRGIRPQVLVAGEQREVAVDACGLFVVVAGADVAV